jgi:hypothetical protein
LPLTKEKKYLRLGSRRAHFFLPFLGDLEKLLRLSPNVRAMRVEDAWRRMAWAGCRLVDHCGGSRDTFCNCLKSKILKPGHEKGRGMEGQFPGKATLIR